MKYILAILITLFLPTLAHARGGSGAGGRGVRGGPGSSVPGQSPGNRGTGPTKNPKSPTNNTNKNPTDYIEQVLREESDANRDSFLFAQRDLSLVGSNYEQIKTQKIFKNYH